MIYLKILQYVVFLANMIVHSMSHEIDGLVQERRKFIANTLELRLSYTNPSKYAYSFVVIRLFWFIISFSCDTFRNWNGHYKPLWTSQCLPTHLACIQDKSDSLPKAKTWHTWHQIQIRWWLEPSTRK